MENLWWETRVDEAINHNFLLNGDDVWIFKRAFYAETLATIFNYIYDLTRSHQICTHVFFLSFFFCGNLHVNIHFNSIDTRYTIVQTGLFMWECITSRDCLQSLQILFCVIFFVADFLVCTGTCLAIETHRQKIIPLHPLQSPQALKISPDRIISATIGQHLLWFFLRLSAVRVCKKTTSTHE